MLARAGAATLVALTAATAFGGPALAAEADQPAPVPNALGRYFVDGYQTNVPGNDSPQSNAAIAPLSEFSDLWRAGDSWNDGTALRPDVLDANIDKVVQITHERTPEEAAQAYLYDRRNQSYSAIGGFGPYADAVRELANAGTTIPDEIPADATSVKYDDQGNANGSWADVDSELGKVVELVNTVRGTYSSGNHAKVYYSYMRPWRWSDDVLVVPQLEPARSTTPETDGGFPSGHTNAVYMADLAFAYAYPERYQELVTAASEGAHSRIVAGMHSPMDVMGGRILGTALAAAILGDPANAELAADAHAQAEEQLSRVVPEGDDPYGDYEANRAAYRERLTYGFEPIGDTTVPATVPKGAEALLATRYPYLSDAQIREVLRTTALPSGYPLLDDPEGWGRLDLFSAASGYGAFDAPVTVSLDAAVGGLAAADTWRNDITGAGSLTADGTGSLTLAGDNAYTGGTTVAGGTLVAASPSALGTGSVQVEDGTLAETVDGTVTIGGDLTQGAGSELRLTLEGDDALLRVAGTVTPAGALVLDVADGTRLPDDVVLIQAGAVAEDAAFSDLSVTGLPEGYDAELAYRDGAVHLVNAAADDGGAAPSEPGPEQPTPAPTATAAPAPGETPAPAAGATPPPADGQDGGSGSAPDAGAADPVAADESLAETGSDASTLVITAAVAALLLGSGAVLLVRRRLAQR